MSLGRNIGHGSKTKRRHSYNVLLREEDKESCCVQQTLHMRLSMRGHGWRASGMIDRAVVELLQHDQE